MNPAPHVPSPRLRRHRLTLAGWCGMNLALLAVLSVLAEYAAERTWVTTLLAYAPPLLYTPVSVLLLLVALLRRRRAAIVLCLIAAAFLAVAFLGVRLPRLGGGLASGPHLRVMTWNIAHAPGGADAVARVIRGLSPDVVCLQEVNGLRERKLLDPLPDLARALPEYRWERAGEVAVGSRLATRQARTQPLLTRAGVFRVALAVPVQVPGRAAPVTITTAHLATAATAESVSTRKTGLPAYLHRTTQARGEQIARLNVWEQQLPGPRVLCGDFNTPPRGVMYRRLCQGRRDAWADAGRGVGWTFSSKHPLLRIDHVFTSPGLVPESCRTAAIAPAVSDHLPVICDLAVAP